ncbi:uncharacterized protein YlxW (UPF0749 family) [Nocardioides zeae]|uniref:Uncharacterized protein YlxW (UPF0749 family) n=1 Tax=Nocardioides zeae TaxID=1457234 RepID=A0ACC6II67_9ACTN|nr:DUF881 domain-containing protein [Nocardioides zeae]MDR6176240.1 uncharacterized protein YlxW (UPF0749 family) [Nocardioides zeae]MDR6210386.1 uncharacterized protein YlxW (UPF0749 family) [Nocardioides zeae]
MSDRSPITLPLLERVVQQSLEGDYAHVAAQRARSGGPEGPLEPRERRVGRTAAVVVGVFGLLVATAAVQTERQAATDETSRTELVGRANEGRARLADLQGRIADLTQETTDLQAAYDRSLEQENAVASEVDALRLATGYSAVTGPGVRFVVDDGEDGGDDGDSVVVARDLRQLVTGLWEVGAEAIAINGLRLTALSSITTSGTAITVNQRSLAPPYVVSAIGDTRSLQADFADTVYGQTFFAVVSSFDLQLQIDNVEALELPAGSTPVLRNALPVGADAPTLSDPTTPSGSSSSSTEDTP